MAPVEDFQSRDLEWISDFIMQQMVIMLRPVLDHLHQTDAAVDDAQRIVQRLSMSISEVRGDVERTNKCVTILRHGLGIQNEGRCVLQHGLDGASRAAKRLDDQMEGVLGAVRGMEASIVQLCCDVRSAEARQEELSQQTVAGAALMEDKTERLGREVCALKETLLSSEAMVEACHRELRERRRGGAGREHWPQKRAPFVAPVDDKDGLSFTDNKQGGGCQHSKRAAGRLAAKAGILPQEHDPGPARGPSRAAARSRGGADGEEGEASLLSQPGALEVHSRLAALEEHLCAAREQLQASREANHGDAARLEERLEAHGGELAGLRRAVSELGGEVHAGSKLPRVASRQGSGASRQGPGSGDAPRMRFTATMASPPERSSSG